MADLKYGVDLDVKGALKGLKDFKKSLSGADKEMDKIDKSANSLNKTFSGLKVILSSVAALGFGAITKASLDTADALGKVSTKVGISVKSLQELRFVADQAGISSKTLDTSLQRFSRRVGEAANGTGVLRKDLDKMNIAIRNTDGTMRSVDSIFTDYINGIRNASSAQEKLRLSVAAFDMEGANMVNMLGESADAFQDMRTQASALAPLLGDSQVKSATRANDAWAKVKFQFKQISLVVLNELAPGLEALATSISNILSNKDEIQDLRDAFKGVSDALKTIAGVLSNDFISTLFDVAKWAALGIAVRALGKGFHFAGRILGEYKTALNAASKAGTALSSANSLGAIASTKFFKAIQWGIKTVAWTALLGFLLDIKGSLVTLTGVFGSAEEGANGFFDTLHQKAIAFAESDVGVIETALSGIRGLVEGATGGTGGHLLDSVFGKDFGKPVTIDTRKEIPGYVRDNEEEIAAAKAQTKALNEEAKKRRDSFKLPSLNSELFKKQIDEIGTAAVEANKPFLALQETLDPLSAATKQFTIDQQTINDALARGDISKERASELLKELTKNYDAFRQSTNGPELNAQTEQWKEYQRTIQETAKSYTPIQTQAEKFKKTAKELKDALAAKNPKLYAIAINNLNKEMRAFNRAQLGQSKKWSDGWKRAMIDYVDDAKDAASQAESLFKKATQGMEDAIVGFAKTGKFEWKSFVSSMLEDLLRSQIRSLFGKLMGGLTGVFSSSTSAMTQTIGQIPGPQSSGNGPIGDIFGGGGSAIGGQCVKLCPDSAKEIGTVIGDKQGSIFDDISGAIGGVWDSISGGVGDIFGGITSGAGDIWDSVSGILGDGAGSVLDSIIGLFDSGSSGVLDSITGLFNNSSLNDYINGGGIGGATSNDQFSGPLSAISGAVNDLTSMFDSSNLFGTSNNSLNDYINGGGIGGAIKDPAAEARAADRANQQNYLSSLASNAFDGISEIGSSIGGAVSSIGSDLWDFGSSVVSGIGDIFGGFFANGGVIPNGQFGIVGERGPEIVSGPANITPMNGSSSNATYNININATDAASFQQLVARDPGFIAAVVQQGMKSYAGGIR